MRKDEGGERMRTEKEKGRKKRVGVEDLGSSGFIVRVLARPLLKRICGSRSGFIVQIRTRIRDLTSGPGSDPDPTGP